MPGLDCIGKSNRCHETAQVVCSLPSEQRWWGRRALQIVGARVHLGKVSKRRRLCPSVPAGWMTGRFLHPDLFFDMYGDFKLLHVIWLSVRQSQ
jgi:hypothetical protein